jgi:hypothetical protein
MKDATDPKIPPTRRDPTASGMALPVAVASAMQEPATITPTTAAKSSSKTTFTLGSWERKTVKSILIF